MSKQSVEFVELIRDAQTKALEKAQQASIRPTETITPAFLRKNSPGTPSKRPRKP
jgi:hypothetical protein